MADNFRNMPCLVVNDVYDIFECNVCKDLPASDHIYQCPNGHLVCVECHAKLTYCPVCRIVLRRIRSISAEKAVSKVPRTCTFASYGCTLRMIKEQLQEHLMDCLYKPLLCPYRFCKEDVTKQMLMD